MRNKEQMKLRQLQEEISKAFLPVRADLCNNFKSIILQTDQRKIYPSWGLFWRSRENIYSLLPIMLHIIPWNLMLMLHIRQSIYLVLTNVFICFISECPHYIRLNFITIPKYEHIIAPHVLSTSIFTRIEER